MLRSKVTQLPGHIQGVYVQNILKLYSAILIRAEAEDDTETVQEVTTNIIEKLPIFVQSGNLEVQERVRECSWVVYKRNSMSGIEQGFLFASEMHMAQQKL